jgi:Domain of unknown function (DUF4328)
MRGRLAQRPPPESHSSATQVIAAPIPSRSPFRPARGRARMARAALSYVLLVALARGVLFFLGAWLTARPESPGSQYLGDLLVAADIVSGALLIVAIMAWLAWVAWTSRLEDNARALGAGAGGVGPRGAIIWWLIPVANLVMPCGQLIGLDRRLTAPGRRSHEVLIAAWWIGLLLAMASVVATSGLLLLHVARLEGAATYAAIGAASLVACVGALLALRVVSAVQSGEDQRAGEGHAPWQTVPGGQSATTGATYAPGVASPVLSGGVAPPGPPASMPYGPAAYGAQAYGSAPAFDGAPPYAPPTVAPPTYAPPTYALPGPDAAPIAPPPGSFMVPVAAPAIAAPDHPRRRVAWLLVAALAALVIAVVAAALIPLNPLGGGSGIGPGASRTAGATTGSGRASPTVAAVVPTVAPPTALGAGGSPGSVTSPGTGTPSAAAPTPLTGDAAVQYLLAHTSSGDGTCAEATAASRPPGSIAAITCQPAGTDLDTLVYSAYGTPAEAQHVVEAARIAAGLAVGSGDCFSAKEGESDYSTNGLPRGRVVCALIGTGATARSEITWYDSTLSIVGEATAPGASFADVCHWWATESGPS